MLSGRLLGIGEASSRLGVEISTLREWDRSGLLKAVKTKGGHRRYRVEDIESLQGLVSEKNPPNNSCVAIYVRVSSYDQKKRGDLESQKSRIIKYCNAKQYRIGYIFEDIAPSINNDSPKLHRLFDLAIGGKINKVVMEHKDRLSFFNVPIFVKLFESHGVTVEWCEGVLSGSYEEELIKEIRSLPLTLLNAIKKTDFPWLEERPGFPDTGREIKNQISNLSLGNSSKF